MGVMGINEKLWDFPMDYNLKVIGKADSPLVEIVQEIISRHVENFDADRITSKNSRNGQYLSLTIWMRLTSKEQMENLYAELGAREEIAWTL